MGPVSTTSRGSEIRHRVRPGIAIPPRIRYHVRDRFDSPAQMRVAVNPEIALRPPGRQRRSVAGVRWIPPQHRMPRALRRRLWCVTTTVFPETALPTSTPENPRLSWRIASTFFGVSKSPLATRRNRREPGLRRPLSATRAVDDRKSPSDFPWRHPCIPAGDRRQNVEIGPQRCRRRSGMAKNDGLVVQQMNMRPGAFRFRFWMTSAIGL